MARAPEVDIYGPKRPARGGTDIGVAGVAGVAGRGVGI